MTIAFELQANAGLAVERTATVQEAVIRTPPRAVRDRYFLRVITTGVSFFLFGFVGVFLGVLFVPVLLAVPGSRAARQARVRHMIRYAFRALVGFMNRSGALSYSLSGMESLGRPGQLVIANHPSLIDIVFLIAFVPGAACVVKRAAWRNPSMVIAVHAAGFVPNAPTDSMIQNASVRLADGECLIMFPEGTRSVPGQPSHFHRGAASVALRSARVVTPVFIDVRPPHLSKGVPWYRVPDIRPHYALSVGPDIDPAAFRERPAPCASRALNEHFKACYAPVIRTT